MSYLLILFIILPLLAMALVLLTKRAGGTLAGLTGLGLSVLAIYLYFIRPFNTLMVFHLRTNLVLDGFSHLILLAVNLVVGLVILYSVAYFSKDNISDNFYPLFLALLAGLNGVLLAGDLLTMFIFLELAAFSSYALVAFRREYFIPGEIASVMVLIAGALIFSATGTFDLAQISYLFPSAAAVLRSAVAILLLAGLGMKAALAPFHAWLPEADDDAPAPVAAMLSAVIIKVLGVYVIVRLFFNVLGLSWQAASVLTIFGGASILIGGFLAIGQRDIKRLLAYSSISQIGYILIGFGLATPLGIMGGVFHLFNHMFMKALLALNAGSVEKATGSRDLEELGGLSRTMPATSATTLVGSLAVSGIPPFNGFWSKLFIILACLQAGRFWLALAAISGAILTLAAFLNMMQKVFFGEGRGQGREREVPWPMVTATVILAVACLGSGLAYPYLLQTIINPAVVALLSGAGYGRMIAGAL